MSLIEPEELRYASISMFGLIVMSTLLDWTGIGSGYTRYEPSKPSSSDVSNVTSVGDRSVLDSFMDPDLTSSGVGPIIDIVLTPIQYPVNILLQWMDVWDAMGFMSIFIIVPMMIMMFILGGIGVKLLSTILP